MGSAESELTTVPRKVYLSSFECCGDSNETFSWQSQQTCGEQNEEGSSGQHNERLYQLQKIPR